MTSQEKTQDVVVLWSVVVWLVGCTAKLSEMQVAHGSEMIIQFTATALVDIAAVFSIKTCGLCGIVLHKESVKGTPVQ